MPIQRFTPTDDQILLFNEIVLILKPYSKLMRVIEDSPTRYEIWTAPLIRSQAINKKEKRYQGALFAGVSIRKLNVGFYFFPLYKNPALKDQIDQGSLLSTLDGSSAFHITELTIQMKVELKMLLEVGIKYYKEIGWVR